MFGAERSTKLVRKWLKLKPQEIQPIFFALNHKWCEDRAICDQNVRDIINCGVVKMKRYERSSNLEVLGYSLRVGPTLDLLIKDYDIVASCKRAAGQT